MENRVRYALLLLTIIGWTYGTSQDINSPYSHFGIGNLYSGQTSINAAMGGIGIGLKGNAFINILNPASYGFFDSTSFVFQGGILGDFVNTRTETMSASSRNVQLGYILMGFPITSWLKTSLGLTPYSRAGYLIYENQYQDSIGRITNSYMASGGLNRAHIGLALHPLKGLSVGTNASFLFGSLDYQQVVDFPDSLYISSFRVINNRNVQDFMFEVGAQYAARLTPNLEMTTGVTCQLAASLNTKRYLLAETFVPGLNNIDYVKDTVVYSPDEKGTVDLPMGIGGGITLEKPNRWMVGGDVYMQKWADFRSYGANDSLSNSLRMATGAQFIPSSSTMAKYMERISYRVGFHYNKTYLKLRNHQINEFGLTFGAGLPLKAWQSMINLAVEIGQRGTISDGLIRENYIRISIGLSIYERWFIRSKFY